MTYNIPENLKYTDDHEWAKFEDGIVTIGITDFAQSQLGDIVFVELPEVGTALDKGGSFGVVESIKSVSDLYSPITGEVVEVNDSLESEPESINADSYGSWIIKVKVGSDEEYNSLLASNDYIPLCDS